jgi:RHS repeat-associated protein
LTAVGDWTSVTTNGTAQSRTHGPTHELLTAGGQTVAPDVKGNITTLPVNLRPAGSTTAMNLNWDSDNKLRSADIDANGTADVNFQYDALGRRVARSGTGGSVVYVQMEQQTIADYPVGGAATTPTFRYVYASYIDEPVVRKTAGTGGTLVYFHRNHQYSITAVTTSTGAIAERYAYSAYGQPTVLDASASVLSSSAINNRYTYTGREWDATLGLHHFRARWMSGLTGRFLTRDPFDYIDGTNMYSVLNGQLLWGKDPLGLSGWLQPCCPPCKCESLTLTENGWTMFRYPNYGFGLFERGYGLAYAWTALATYSGEPTCGINATVTGFINYWSDGQNLNSPLAPPASITTVFPDFFQQHVRDGGCGMFDSPMCHFQVNAGKCSGRHCYLDAPGIPVKWFEQNQNFARRLCVQLDVTFHVCCNGQDGHKICKDLVIQKTKCVRGGPLSSQAASVPVTRPTNYCGIKSDN